MIGRVRDLVPGMVQQIVQQFDRSLGATAGADREVEPAVGEVFVVMFENQFASREHDSRVPCPTRGIADAGGMAIRLSAGVAQRMRRVGEYVHGRRTASRRGAVGGTRVARGRVVFASVIRSGSCRSRSQCVVMGSHQRRGDFGSAHARRALVAH